MRMSELKSLARERRLRNYSRMRKAQLVALLQNNPPPAPRTRPPWPTRPPPSPPPTQTWEPIDDRRRRKPSPQEMDIFEQQEMSKSRPQVKGKLNKWYDWLINHVPKPSEDGASKAFKLLRIRLWGCFIGLLVPLVMKRELMNPNHLNQYSLSKLLEGLTGPIGLMENQRWMLIRSLIE